MFSRSKINEPGPKAAEPESWTVLIDDLGEIKVERATN